MSTQIAEIIADASGLSNQVIIFLVALVGASLPVSIGAIFVRRKTKAEVADIITDAAGRLVDKYEVRVTDLEARLRTSEEHEEICREALTQTKEALLLTRVELASTQRRVLDLEAQVQELIHTQSMDRAARPDYVVRVTRSETNQEELWKPLP